MRKLITLSLTVFLVGLFAAVVYAAVQSGDGSRSDDDPAGHDRGDDRRGEVEDHSGPGRGGDDASGDVEDHSGPGHGGDDNSGSEHGGRDHAEDD